MTVDSVTIPIELEAWHALPSVERADLFAKYAEEQFGKCKAIKGRLSSLEKWRRMYLSAHDPKEYQNV